jgi:hypothetical protein
MVSHTALQIAYYQSGRDHMDVEDVLEFFEQRSEEHRGRATSKASAHRKQESLQRHLSDSHATRWAPSNEQTPRAIVRQSMIGLSSP